MRNRMLRLWLLFSVFTFSTIIGCASSFQPHPLEEVHFQERSQTRSKGNFRVTAAVLSAEETEAVFGFALYKKGIQPIWLEIENKDDKPTWFLPYSVDPDYFPPLEVTYPYHRTFDDQYNDHIDRYFLKHAMGLYLAPDSIRSGFVFTNLDLGTKSFNVDLVGDDNQAHTFTFFIPVPGLQSDHQDVDFDKLYSANEMISYREADFRKALGDLPCCVTNEDGTKQGGPINIVIVAHGEDLLRVLIRSGWNETATTRTASGSKKEISSDIPQGFRYKPVAPLYYYGRQQDASFRDPRAGGFERNKLRLWLSPMQFEGQEVWLGQISRDYGKQSAGRTLNKLDLDEVRSFLLQSLWYAQGINKYGFVKGTTGAVAPISHPKTTFRGTAYITDGYRVVLWLSEKSVPLSDVEVVDWDSPPER
ncbi:hypothetical protein D1BOALGB6SA_1576 [Olavius sp. associated proteobacterium Delta 1]|nr:hypothetical protein D1BOALGB6SA_1576 [Olavius sp. associated proteobacterium Delta 1]